MKIFGKKLLFSTCLTFVLSTPIWAVGGEDSSNSPGNRKRSLPQHEEDRKRARFDEFMLTSVNEKSMSSSDSSATLDHPQLTEKERFFSILQPTLKIKN